MPFLADGKDLKLGAASIMLAEQDADGNENGFEFTGEVDSCSFSADVQTVESYDHTTQAGALLDRSVVRTGINVAFQCKSYTIENIRRWLKGTENVTQQAVSTGEDITLSNVVLGRYYQLGSRRVTGVTGMNGTDALVLNEDYTLNTEYGIVRILPTSPRIVDGDDPVFTFARPALEITQTRINNKASSICHLLVLSDDKNTQGNAAKDRVECWRVDIAPDGELNVIGEEHGVFSFTGAILSDSENHPNDPYGVHERVTG